MSTNAKNVWSRHQSVRDDEKEYDVFHCYTEVADTWTDPHDGTVYDNDFTPVWRWRRAMLNNCQARFDWCVKTFDDANHHPTAAVNDDATDSIVRLQQPADTAIKLDSSGSIDPDGDQLNYRWYFYPEAGTYRGELPALSTSDADHVKLTLPADAAGAQLHLIPEVSDDSEIVSLYDYRRIVIDVEER